MRILSSMLRPAGAFASYCLYDTQTILQAAVAAHLSHRLRGTLKHRLLVHRHVTLDVRLEELRGDAGLQSKAHHHSLPSLQLARPDRGEGGEGVGWGERWGRRCIRGWGELRGDAGFQSKTHHHSLPGLKLARPGRMVG